MYITSVQDAISIRQAPAPLIIGETLNTTAGGQAKILLAKGDINGLVALGRRQAEQGAHCIDVCVESIEHGPGDESRIMLDLVKKLSQEVNAPLVIDSTDSDVISEAVRACPGLPIINSVNLNSSDNRFEKLLPVITNYGVPFIAMCMTDSAGGGQARTAQDKLKAATEMYEYGVSNGCRTDQFLIDPLVFPMTGSPDDALNAIETINGLKLIKQKFPECHTVCGISNISARLGNIRKTLNSVFLYHMIQAGLDAAILNISQMTAYTNIPKKERALTEALLFNQHKNAMADCIEYFEGKTQTSKTNISPTKPLDPLQALYECITNRLPNGITHKVDDAIKLQKVGDSKQDLHEAALKVLSESLLPAMKEVGDKFGKGELILPYVLSSAECMKSAVSHLETYLIKADDARTRGTIVLGTVYGDVHDIGKNLVKTILANNGYKVIDLGRQVPVQKFVEVIKEHKADAVGLSALLVSTSKQMQVFAEYAAENNLQIPILYGGAAINSGYIDRINNSVKYDAGMFFCKDMFAGLNVVNVVCGDDEEAKINLLEKRKKEMAAASNRKVRERPVLRQPKIKSRPLNRNIKSFTTSETSIKLDEIWQHLDLKDLFTLSWGIQGRASTKEQKILHEDILAKWKLYVKEQDMFEPYIIYGLFECSRKGENGLEIFTNDKRHTLDFPRVNGLCLADYFDSKDIVGLQAVSVGCKASVILEKMEKSDKYTDLYYLHGLCTQSAESLAAIANQRLVKAMDVEKALRYSWGYPACPDVNQHKYVWGLLDVPKEIMTLSDAGQIIPEHSTAAIVVHHPQAKYF